MKTNVIKLSESARTANVYYVNGQHKVDYYKNKQIVKEDYFLTQYDAINSARNFAFNVNIKENY